MPPSAPSHFTRLGWRLTSLWVRHRDVVGHDPLASVPPSRNPFQVWLLTASVASGWVNLLEGPDTSFNREMPGWIAVAWGLILVLGGTIGLISAWWSDRITGLLLERTALGSMAMAMFAYGSVVLYTFGWIGFQTSSMTIAAGIACLWRVRHINRELAILAIVSQAKDNDGSG